MQKMGCAWIKALPPARLLEKLKAEGKPVPWGRKRGGVNRSAAERQLAQASKQHARARRDLGRIPLPRSFGGTVIRLGRQSNARLSGFLRSTRRSATDSGYLRCRPSSGKPLSRA